MSTLCPACGRTFDDAYRLCPFDGTGLVRAGEHRLAPGAALEGRYLVTGTLGEGGTGLVYRAEDAETGRVVVLKVIRPEHAESPEQVARFLGELKVGARVRSPRVRQVLGTTRTDEGRLVLVLDYVDGRSLAEILACEGHLTEVRALALAREVALALADVHAAGVVHRDLKPSNLLVSGIGGTEAVTLLDLGVARRLDVPPALSDVEGADSVQTHTGHVVGTPAYLSPEAILGDPVDPRADLYALGVMLHEMLCGARPFDAPSFGKLLLKHLNEVPRALGERSPPVAVSAGTEALLAVLLAKEPDRRPSTAAAVVAAIDPLLAGLRAGRAPRRALPTETLEVAAPGPARLPPAPAGSSALPSFSLGAPLADEGDDQEPPSDDRRRTFEGTYELHRGDELSWGQRPDAPGDLRNDERLRARRDLDRAESRGLTRARWTRRVLGFAATLLALATVAWLAFGDGRAGTEALLETASGRWDELNRTLDSWSLDQPDPPGRRMY